MAELIGVISGLITVGTVGFQLFKVLSNLAKGIGAARKDILLLANEIKVTSDVLLLIQESLDRSHTNETEIFRKAVNIFPGLIAQCELVYGYIRDLIAFLSPFKDDQEIAETSNETEKKRTTSVLLSKLLWQKEKHRVFELRGYVEPLKSTLNLLLLLLRDEAASRKPQYTDLRDVIREELKNALTLAQSQPTSLDDRLAKVASAQAQPTPLDNQLAEAHEDRTVTVRLDRENMRPQQATRDLAVFTLSSTILQIGDGRNPANETGAGKKVEEEFLPEKDLYEQALEALEEMKMLFAKRENEWRYRNEELRAHVDELRDGNKVLRAHVDELRDRNEKLRVAAQKEIKETEMLYTKHVDELRDRNKKLYAELLAQAARREESSCLIQ